MTTTKTRTHKARSQRSSSDRDEKLTALHEQITAGVANLLESGAWQAMLDTAAKFHRYSLGNQILIGLQAPTATRLAGFGTWRSLGRHVRKGEKGIAILAPCTYRATSAPHGDDNTTDTGEDEAKTTGQDTAKDGAPARQVLRGFRPAYVFDVAQTDGDPLPDLGESPVTGAVPAGLWDGLAAQVAAHGYTLTRGDCGSAEGYTHPGTRIVRISGTENDAAAVGVLAHELAHIECGHVQDLPTYRTCRGRCDIEAESIAYVVTAAHGVDTSGSTFGYVTGWAHGDPEAVRAAATTVTQTARRILDHLNPTEDPHNEQATGDTPDRV